MSTPSGPPGTSIRLAAVPTEGDGTPAEDIPVGEGDSATPEGDPADGAEDEAHPARVGPITTTIIHVANRLVITAMVPTLPWSEWPVPGSGRESDGVDHGLRRPKPVLAVAVVATAILRVVDLDHEGRLAGFDAEQVEAGARHLGSDRE